MQKRDTTANNDNFQKENDGAFTGLSVYENVFFESIAQITRLVNKLMANTITLKILK